MTASYPAAFRQFTTKQNYTDIVWAEHMNTVQEETRAIQETLGIVPQKATNNPGGLKPDHGTVSARIQSIARGEQVPIFRGSAKDLRINPGRWTRATLRADDDPFSLSTGTGIRLNEAGLWSFTIKADWRSETDTLQREAVRLLRLEVNGDDIGVRDSLEESVHNKNALHQHITWEDTYDRNTIISMAVAIDLSTSGKTYPVHCYMRAHLVRCHDYTGEGGSVPFEDAPQPGGGGGGSVVTPPPGERCFRVIANFQGHRAYAVNDAGKVDWSVMDLSIVDNSSRWYDDSPHPVFTSWEEADGYRQQLWTELTGKTRVWNETIADTIGGIQWRST